MEFFLRHCQIWRSFALSCARVDLTFSQRSPVCDCHWTGERVQSQHLGIFSADLTFLDWIISRKLWNFERKLPYDTGKPFGPQRRNLFKFAQLQGAWLPAPSPRRRRSLRTPRVLWLGLVQLVMFKALSILSGIWHRHAEFVIWEDNKWLVAWRKTGYSESSFFAWPLAHTRVSKPSIYQWLFPMQLVSPCSSPPYMRMS